MDKSLLVRVFGFPATLVHGDTLVLDRWRWLKNRLPVTANGERLLDVGCGTGAFTIGAARRGYRALGLSWDERNQATAQYRAELCHTPGASFDVLDVRRLDTRSDLRDTFDVALCLECVEHILDDRKLIRDIAACLRPGGRLLLTTPNYDYRAITREDNGPFAPAETGWHVRRGYTQAMLRELCDEAELRCEEVGYCSGWMSQKVTLLLRALSSVHPLIGWGLTLPLRLLPPAFDGLLTRCTGWPGYSICLTAYKPRFRHPAPAGHDAAGGAADLVSTAAD
jgi:2-polyprenyl-3-methyl-5-hydroxy-6-metoxy-1,4-benzoquinol methylase